MGGVFWFRSEAFEARKPRPDAVNENIGGDDLAEWLVAKLRDSGLKAATPWAEDHGWDFSIVAFDSTYMLACACEIGDWSGETPEHSVILSKQRGMMDRLRGRNAFTPDDPVKAAIEKILKAEPQISALRWEPDAAT
ncbi:MAG: hypothetical protein ACRCXM_17445 [Beijerinckiaceae bacterium]